MISSDYNFIKIIIFKEEHSWLKTRPEDLDWNNLGFKYHDLPFRWVDKFQDGKWQGGQLTSDSTITFNEAAEELHYGQEIFEGLKAYRRKDGGINLFRPDQNAEKNDEIS